MPDQPKKPEAFPAWETLPDFGLYMDQLLTFTERCFPGEVTAGMINSYVKAGIIRRPAMPLDSLRKLLHLGDAPDTAALYEGFRRDWAELHEALPARADMDALRCAIAAACYQARCREMLEAQEAGARSEA